MTDFSLKDSENIENSKQELILNQKPIENIVEKQLDKIVEMGKDTPGSIISVNREFQLNINIVSPKQLDVFYATVPEITRAIDLRGSAIIYRGYEISPANDSSEAKQFANIVSFIVEKSGGVNFFEQWQKNGDLYGDGYVELVDDNTKIIELAHVHPFEFGYELETFFDEGTSSNKSRIKLDPETQKPVGYATYKFDELDEIFVNDKLIPLEKIAHLKYKVIGDALNGISLVQPMGGSVIRKLKLETNMESAGNLVSAPKIVIKGDFADDEEAKEQAREAANLDVNDVIVLQNEKDFTIVNPGKTSLPELREVFVVNITTASGVPRPILTSESSEINKSTMQELMRQLRENMRSNMAKMINIAEHKIFRLIGQSYDINNFENIVPKLRFPEDSDTEEEIIVREEKKAATLTSLSNSITILNTMLLGKTGTPPNASMKKEIEESMTGLFETLNQTMDTFNVNNDQIISKQEEEMPEIVDGVLKLTQFSEEDELQTEKLTGDRLLDAESADSVTVDGTLVNVTLVDEDLRLLNLPSYIEERHYLLHVLYDAVIQGSTVFDALNGKIISVPVIIKKHQFYITQMEKLGLIHEVSELGAELDETV